MTSREIVKISADFRSVNTFTFIAVKCSQGCRLKSRTQWQSSWKQSIVHLVRSSRQSSAVGNQSSIRSRRGGRQAEQAGKKNKGRLESSGWVVPYIRQSDKWVGQEGCYICRGDDEEMRGRGAHDWKQAEGSNMAGGEWQEGSVTETTGWCKKKWIAVVVLV